MTLQDFRSTRYISNSERAAQAAQVERLSNIASKWRTTGQQPDETGPLSSGEYRAVCLAAGQPTSLQDPVGDFLLLDDWLQRWVLHERGLVHLIGTNIGGVLDSGKR